MILIKVTNQGSFHFLMNDGRVGVSSPSGYVRINTKNTNHFTMEKQFYQINKVKKHLNLFKIIETNWFLSILEIKLKIKGSIKIGRASCRERE